MNKKIYFGALVALSLFACNQAEEPQPSIVSSSENVEGTFELNLSATVSDDAMRALSFQGLEDLSETPKISANSDFTTHAFFRKAGSPEVGYATIHWEARQEGGRVKLIRPTTNIALANMSDQTIDEGEEWYVSGIAGGGVLNSEKTAVSFEPDLSSAAEALRAPIAFKWTRIYKNKMSNVHFQPKGVLLRAVVANHVGKDVPQIDFDMTSNELDYNGKFDFSAAANSMQAIEQGGHEPVWKFSTGDFGTAQASTLKFRAKDFAKDSKQRIMIWGMSRELSSGQKLTVKPSTAKTVEVLRSGRVYPFESQEAMQNTEGYTIEVDLDVLNPLQYLAPANLKQDGKTFATDDELNNSGFFTFAQTREFRDDHLKKIPGYTPPNSYQVAALGGYYARNEALNQHTPTVAFQHAWSRSRDDEDVQIGSVVMRVSSSYRSLGNGIVYALRMQKSNNEPSVRLPEDIDQASMLPEPIRQADNSRTMIWRYERKSNGRIKISAARVGDDPSITLDRISNEDWWNESSNTWFSENKVRVFSTEFTPTGEKHASTSAIEYKNNVVSWWTTTAALQNGAVKYLTRFYGFGAGLATMYGDVTDTDRRRAVRLFKDMDI